MCSLVDVGVHGNFYWAERESGIAYTTEFASGCVSENLYFVNIGLHRKIYAPEFQRLSRPGICIY